MPQARAPGRARLSSRLRGVGPFPTPTRAAKLGLGFHKALATPCRLGMRPSVTGPVRHAKRLVPMASAGSCEWRRHARMPRALVVGQCRAGPLAAGDKGALNDFDGRQPAGDGSGRSFRTGLTEVVAAVARL